MRTAIIVFPGTNRERDMALAVKLASGKEPVMVWHKEIELPKVDIIILPGGFSFGDYLRAGAMAARSPIVGQIIKQAKRGLPILGVCNGFQILTEIGLLPGALMRNTGLKFICRNVDLRVETTESIFTTNYRKGQVITVPIAHNDGNYFADRETLKRLEGDSRIAFKYVDGDGNITTESNPNGSSLSIAGILDKTRRIMGLMPHPENATDPKLGGTDGQRIFGSIMEAVG